MGGMNQVMMIMMLSWRITPGNWLADGVTTCHNPIFQEEAQEKRGTNPIAREFFPRKSESWRPTGYHRSGAVTHPHSKRSQKKV